MKSTRPFHFSPHSGLTSTMSNIYQLKMCSWNRIITGLLLGIIVLTALTLGEPLEITETNAWVGEEVDLECGDGGPNSAARFWKKGDDVVTVGDFDVIMDDRIHSVNSSTILRIANATLDDEGQYTCIVQTSPTQKHTIRLHVKEAFCEAPKNPLNGGYVNESVSDDGYFKFNDKIRYYCDSGFELIGEELHTCGGTHRGWSAEEPHCESKHMTQLSQGCDTLQFNVTDIDNKMTTIMDKVARIDNRLTDYEAKQNDLSHLTTTKNSNLTLFKIIMSELDSFKEQLSKDGKLATVDFKDGSVVSQFTWMVENIEEEITKAKGNESYYIESKPFYTNVPGYRVQLLLYPSDSNSVYVGVYVKLVKGEFDNVLLWPFSSRHEFFSVSREGSRINHQLVNPPIEKGCPGAFLQPPKTDGSCGVPKYLKIDTVLSDKDNYLIDGALSIQLNVWLNK